MTNSLNSPFFSIIIPVKSAASISLLKKALKSIEKQSFRRFETILVSEKENKTRLGKIKIRSGKTKIFFVQSSKTQARNFGAKKARGQYLLHIDIDYVLKKNVLKRAYKLIKEKKAKAIVINEKIEKSQNIWQEARRLEREIAIYDKEMLSPQIIEADLFDRIGGFDEDCDALDDWSLYLKLKKRGVKFYYLPPLVSVYERSNPAESFRNKFEKGRYLTLLNQKYGPIPQIAISHRIKVYLRHSNKIISKPLLGITFLFLKLTDWIGIFIGSLNPKNLNKAKIYQFPAVAKNFDAEQKNLYGRIKHYLEIRSLLNLLPPSTPKSPTTILEIGAGTGRITEELVRRGYNVTPADISEPMLKELAKKNLPSPILIKTERLPFTNESFDYTLALRVFWHIKKERERKNLFSEAVRIAKRGIIMDFAIQNRGLNFIFKDDYFLSYKEIEKMCQAYDLKISDQKFLPLGRLLIKFVKPDNPSRISKNPKFWGK